MQFFGDFGDDMFDALANGSIADRRFPDRNWSIAFTRYVFISLILRSYGRKVI